MQRAIRMTHPDGKNDPDICLWDRGAPAGATTDREVAMTAEGSSRIAVVAAIVGNLIIAIIKFVAAAHHRFVGHDLRGHPLDRRYGKRLASCCWE